MKKFFRAFLLVPCWTLAACGGSGADSASGGDGTTADGSGSTDGSTDSTTSSCDINVLFEQECKSCHSSDQPFADLDLISPDLESRLVDVASVSCADWTLVVAGSPQKSLLYQKIALENPPCGDPMPPNGPLLDEAQIACVEDYILSLASEGDVETCETCGTTLCVDLQTDSSHCGSCDTACAENEVCTAGVCEGCPDGTTSCDGSCVDTLQNDEHCGACGNACGGGQTCVMGSCECATDTTVSYSADVQPIFDASCNDTQCHGSSTSAGPGQGAGGPDTTTDLVLESNTSYASLVGVDSGCRSLSFVEPGDVSQSYLMNKLLGQDMCDGSIMPKGEMKLPQSELDTIGAWICAGAPDN